MNRTVWLCLALFFLSLIVFRVSPRGQIYDSQLGVLTSYQWITTGEPALDPFLDQLGGLNRAGRPANYRLVEAETGYRLFYPPGTPMLIAPFVGLAALAGWGPVDEQGRYDEGSERTLQRWLAALAMSLTGVLFFLMARLWLPERSSLLLVLAALLGSPVWSTASRSLWPQTLTLALLGGAAFLLMRGQREKTSLQPILLASLLSWATFCRPTASIAALCVVLWATLYRREAVVPLVVTGAIWLGIFLGIFQFVYGSWLPPYYDLETHVFGFFMPVALAGNLISPARGVLIYSPILLAVLFWLVRFRKSLPDPSLAGLAAAILFFHWLLISTHAPWWAGYSYGPRLFTETVPWWVMLGILGYSARRSARGEWAPWARATVLGLLGISVLMNGVGAISKSAAKWNDNSYQPRFEERLWSLPDAPFLAPFFGPDRRASSSPPLSAPENP